MSKKKTLWALGLTVMVFGFYGINFWKIMSKALYGSDASTVYLAFHAGESAAAFFPHFVIFYLLLGLVEKIYSYWKFRK